MKTCGFYGCSNTYKSFVDISFFKLPKNAKLRLIWIRHSGEQRDYKNMSLCEKHFNPNDVRVTGRRKQLKEFAVPRPSAASTCSCTDGSVDPVCRLYNTEPYGFNTDYTEKGEFF